MFYTKKAQEEIKKLEIQAAEAKKNEDNFYKRMIEAKEHYLRDGLRRDYNKESNKRYRLEDKVKEISKLGFSSTEKRAISKERYTFSTIKYETSLGCRDVVAVGFSKALNHHVKITYTWFTDFMRNVKGCGSLANTVDFQNIELISEEEFKKLTTK
jgi:hypothetical protein